MLHGGAISSFMMSSVLFFQNSIIYFNENQARHGGSIYSSDNSTVTIDKKFAVKFNNNTARWYGGELYSNRSYDVAFDSNGVVTCNTPNTIPYCIQKRCFCKDIEGALASLTMSNNVLIQLTIDVMLPSFITLKDIKNITIIGHNNPTINCGKTGGLHFISCKSVTLVGIIWNECGALDNVSNSAIPGLKFENSSSITIQNCSFQHSVGQAILLSEVSGVVNINHSKFKTNYFRGHGSVIHYSSNNIVHSQLYFIINNCNFTKNINGKVSFISQNLKGYFMVIL